MILRQDSPTLSGTIAMTPDRDAASLAMDPASILEHFALLPDPRREHGQVHRLDEVVFMAICGVLCGADSWQEIADYSESKLDWLSTFLSLPGGIPSHDTFRRVFCLLDPVAFQGCFSDWMTSLMARYGLTPVSPGRPELIHEPADAFRFLASSRAYCKANTQAQIGKHQRVRE